MSERICQGIVISSRVRLARNLADTPFPHRLEAQAQAQLTERIVTAAAPLELTTLYAAQMQQSYQQWLIEEHLCSVDWAKANRGALLLSRDVQLAIMINEEDHLRLQCLLPGMAIDRALERVQQAERALAECLPFAHDDRLGYLSACPSNVGSGLRASAMVHLPALVATGQAKAVFQSIKERGAQVRGLYGEGSEAFGNVFQISNRLSLGKSEQQLCAMINAVVTQVCEAETKARDALYDQHRVPVEDRVRRAFGQLRYARTITLSEAMRHLSDLMLGATLGLIPGDAQALSLLIKRIAPGHLSYEAQTDLPLDQRRAQVCEKVLSLVELE